MNKMLFAEVDNKKIWIDEVLIDYDGAPIFFVCKDVDEQYYASVCIDFDKEEYIIATTTPKDMVQMLKGEESIRNYFLKGNKFWLARFCNGILIGSVNEKKLNEINMEALPKVGEYLILTTKRMKDYANSIAAF